jgi:methylated-DNA-[protein]-cysteine S-methyltransferase
MKSFTEAVLVLVKFVPKGRITTYQLIAQKLGKPGAMQAVGQALKANPYSYYSKCSNKKKVPCHRVIRSDGQLGGFQLGLHKKKQLLKQEGIEIINNKIVDWEDRLFNFYE